MKKYMSVPNPVPRKFLFIVFACLLGLSLAGCTSQAPEPAAQPQVGSHPPQVLRVVEREQVSNGMLLYFYDITFTDPDGDAEALTYRVTSSTLGYTPVLADAAIDASAEQQKSEALFSEVTGCWQKMDLVYEGRIRDQVGNLSEPVRFSLNCTAPQPLDTRSLLMPVLSTGLAMGIVLLLGFWLLFRKQPEQRLSALRSTILVFFLFMILRFLQLVIHEGGHAIHALASGVPITLYVHPFFFRGFSRPIIMDATIWKDVLGSAVALPVGLLLFLLFWKRRSLALLPLVMLFPYIAITDGINLMGLQDDFHNLIQSTGLPAAPFWLLGALISCLGLVSLLSLLPLAGLDPGDYKALFAIPAAMFLICALSLLVAHLVVPASPINLEYFMAREILADNYFIMWVSIGVVLAVLYVTVFRSFSPRLPSWLRNQTVVLSWKDLRAPAILWGIILIIGLVVIT